MTTRREFITLLGGAAAVWPISAGAQQPVRVKRIGLMADLQLRPIEGFRNRLRELGYIEGQNLIVEYRFAEGREERYSDFAAQLVALPVDLIVTWGTPAAFAAKRATTTIPIVLGGSGDVINTGLVSNLARPDANITGCDQGEFITLLGPHGRRAQTLDHLVANARLHKMNDAAALAVQIERPVIATEDRRSFDGYLARPAKGHGPGLVIFSEMWGVAPSKTEMAEDYARRGWCAYAPNMAHLLCGGLRRRLPRDEFPALRRFCPGVEEHEPQAARLAVDLRLDGRAAGDECGVADKAHLAIAAGRALVLRLSRAQGSKPRSLGVGEPRGVGIQKLVVEHRLQRGEIAAAHHRVALVLEGEDFLVVAHRQTSLAVSPRVELAPMPGTFTSSSQHLRLA